MVCIHFRYDLGSVYDWEYPTAFTVLKQWGGILFLLLSGVCVTLGSRHIRRGITVLACGIIDVKPQIRAKEVDIECVAASQIDIDVVADKVTIDVVGAAKAAVKAECTSIEVELTGASTLSLSGKATKGEFDVVGASSLYAESFHCSQLEAECTGASSAEISADMAEVDAAGASTANVACTTRLDASAAGASTIRYSGDCQVNIKEASGASAIKKK